jgi:hypothetical protein
VTTAFTLSDVLGSPRCKDVAAADVDSDGLADFVVGYAIWSGAAPVDSAYHVFLNSSDS